MRLACVFSVVRSMFGADAVDCVASVAFSETVSVNFVAGAAIHICKRRKKKQNPLRRSCVSNGSRSGAVRVCLEVCEPSAEIVRALDVARCEYFLRSANSLRRSGVSKGSRCGAVPVCLEVGEPFAEIVRVEALSLWRRAMYFGEGMFLKSAFSHLQLEQRNCKVERQHANYTSISAVSPCGGFEAILGGQRFKTSTSAKMVME